MGPMAVISVLGRRGGLKSFFCTKKFILKRNQKLLLTPSIEKPFSSPYNCVMQTTDIVSSVRSSSGYHGLLHIYKPSFSNFSNSSDSKVKVKVKGPNMCYIFEKHAIQGYQIRHSRVS